jgi:hypothetical protein
VIEEEVNRILAELYFDPEWEITEENSLRVDLTGLPNKNCPEKKKILLKEGKNVEEFYK